MGNKIGRNDPCWCGSGIKYKKCHLNREDQQPVSREEFIHKRNNEFSRKVCLHPQASKETCGNIIIKSHTLQRKGGLSKIAKDGHVYGISRRYADLFATNGIPPVKLFGVKEASTYFGFCNKHDCSTFAPIDNAPLAFSQKQCFLIGYRSLCKEFYTKAGASNCISLLKEMDRGKDRISQIRIQGFVDAYSMGTKAGLRSITDCKKAYDKVLITHDFFKLRFYALELEQTPEFVCSGAIFPDVDFQNRQLQDLAEPNVSWQALTFCLTPTESGGAVVFTWLADRNIDYGAMMIQSLCKLSEEEKPHAIVRFVFNYFENVYMSPYWWGNLQHSDKMQLERRIANAFSPMEPRLSLIDDGFHVVDWHIKSVHTNLDF